MAANRWEARISNPINVVIDVDFGSTFFGSAFDDTAILGQTGSRLNSTPVLQPPPAADQQLADLGRAPVYNALPASTVPVELSGGSNATLSSVVSGRGQRARLGLASRHHQPRRRRPQRGDSRIGFNSNFNSGNGSFDFNPENGISAGATDFDAVAHTR